MKRWWLVVAGAVGVGLAFLLIRGPSTAPERVPVPAPPPAEPVAPTKRVPPGTRPGESKGTPVPGSIPAQLADPSTPPDVRLAAQVSGQWTNLADHMKYNRTPPAAWAAVVQPASDLAAKIKVFRLDPTTASWPDLVAQQRELIPQIRAADPDDDMTGLLDQIESVLGPG